MVEVSQLQVRVGVNKGSKLTWRRKLAFWHEYGTGKVPARPFIRPTARYLQRHVMPEVLSNVLNVALARRKKIYIGPKRMVSYAKKELARAGDEGVAYMKGRIWKHIPPPLKRATIKQKMRLKFPFPKTPLVAAGDLYESISKKLGKKPKS